MPSSPSPASSSLSLSALRTHARRLHRFRPRLADSLAGYDRERFARDLGAGLTVGVVALPLAMAFAIASGVKPEQGLFTAIIAGFLISALGGSQVQIGGPAGAFIVIVYGIVQQYGLANLLASTVLAGIVLVLMGWFKLGALVRYIPVSIVIGFTNGIAVLIALSQAKEFLGLETPGLPADFFAQVGMLADHIGTLKPAALAIALACLAVVVLWPKSYERDRLPPALRRMALVPGTVVALAGATLATVLLDLDVATIGSRFGGIPQSLPAFAVPALSWEGARQLFMPTITIALLGAIESLLCARVADNLTEFKRHDPNQELMAQGAANIVAPFFGGIPATGTVARTVTNIRAGAATPVAGIVHAATLLLVVLAAAPLARHVPLAALAGILMFVAWNMGEWREFLRLRQFNLPYRIILLGTFVLTVVFDLTVAVQAGLVLACLFFIWRMSTLFQVDVLPPEALVSGLPKGVEVFRLYGALFFGAVGKLEPLPERLAAGTHTLVLDLHRLVELDTTGLDALVHLNRTLRRNDVRLIVCDLNPQPLALLARSGFDGELGPHNCVLDLPAALAEAARPPRP